MQYKDEGWLKKQYYDKDKSMGQISDELDVSKSVIGYWMDKFDLERRTGSDAHRARKHSFELSESDLDVIYGSLLGDAYITEFGQFELETSEREFAEFVHNLLPEDLFSDGQPNEYRYHRISSRVSDELKNIRSDWYEDGKKKVIPEYVELNRDTLLHWFLGDGYVNNGYPWIISNFENTEEFFNQSETELGAKMYDYEYEDGVVRVKFENKQNFYSLIGECPMGCYEHKWGVQK